jgi:hypothetical protein
VKIFRLRRPEMGEEHGVVWFRHHGCPSAQAMKSALEDDDLDLLQWPVGLVGYGMPLNTPFAVETSNSCGVCGKSLTAWFEWTGAKVVNIGGLWTP